MIPFFGNGDGGESVLVDVSFIRPVMEVCLAYSTVHDVAPTGFIHLGLAGGALFHELLTVGAVGAPVERYN
eukprot:46777-Eustigmatos_ZCMA.PRE.1